MVEGIFYNVTFRDSNPRALGKALGALCNPRQPAPQRRSNLSISATSEQALHRLLRFFYFIKCQSALVPLLILSKPNPLRWASVWFFCCRSREQLIVQHKTIGSTAIVGNS